MNKNTANIICIFLIASVLLFSGCAGEERTVPVETPVVTPTPESAPEQTPTGHEQAGEPDKSYLGLADVFKEKPGVEVSTENIQVDREGIIVSGFLVQPAAEGTYPGVVMIHE